MSGGEEFEGHWESQECHHRTTIYQSQCTLHVVYLCMVHVYIVMYIYILACDYVVYVLARQTYFAQSMA